VLIMGATGALCRAIAIGFADAGADVALTTATNDAGEAFALRSVAKAVTEHGRRAVVESVDMSLGTGVQITVRQVAKALGAIDVLVVAPDLPLNRPAERLSDADWARVIGLNLSAVFYACRAVAREMLNRDLPAEQSRGRIIVVAPEAQSDAGAAYRAAKGGVAALVEALDDEWAARGISVTLVSVGDLEDPEAAEAAAQSIIDQASTDARR